jgi:hypothetical protein
VPSALPLARPPLPVPVLPGGVPAPPPLPALDPLVPAPSAADWPAFGNVFVSSGSA